jgi:hypothetical protein
MNAKNKNLGRLIRTLPDKCPLCHSSMQLRARKIIVLVRGVEEDDEEEYKVCSVCDNELEIRQKDRKKRKRVFDKTAYVPEVIDKKEGRGGYKKRDSTSKSNGGKSDRSPRKNSR